MATFSPRTISQIFQSTLTEKTSFASLSGLTTDVIDLPTLLAKLDSNSKVAVWVLWAYINAVNTWTLENIMLDFITEVETEKASASVGSVAWYVDNAKLFQYGDILQLSNNTYKPYYITKDESKQIIGSATGEEQSGNLILKLRRKDTDILSVDEKNAFSSYMNKIKFVGTRIEIRNVEADKLKLYFEIIYDPQTTLSDIQTNVESTINTYIKNLEFDSSFKTNELVDRLQKLTGVLDPRWTGLYGRRDTAVGFTQFTWSYNSYAGYSEIDGSFPLSTTITFTPKTI